MPDQSEHKRWFGLPRLSRLRLQEQLTGYLFISPSLVLMVVFMFLPMLIAIAFSLREANLLKLPGQFIGLKNYQFLFKDTFFWRSLGASLKLAALLIPSQVAIGLGLALLVNQKVRGVGFFRTIYLMPIVMSGVVSGTIWKLLLNRDMGVFNSMLVSMGLSAQPLLTSPQQAILALAAVTIWSSVGSGMVIFLAGLQGIPKDFYDAAKVDGAGTLDCFRHVTLPLLRRTTAFVAIMTTIFSFRLFDSIYVLTGGGPLRETTVLAFYAYKMVFVNQDFGYGATVAVALLLVILVVASLQLLLSRGGVEY